MSDTNTLSTFDHKGKEVYDIAWWRTGIVTMRFPFKWDASNRNNYVLTYSVTALRKIIGTWDECHKDFTWQITNYARNEVCTQQGKNVNSYSFVTSCFNSTIVTVAIVFSVQESTWDLIIWRTLRSHWIYAKYRCWWTKVSERRINC